MPEPVMSKYVHPRGFVEPVLRSDWEQIGTFTQRGIEHYLSDHIPPGSFLRAVFENDLRMAAMYADDYNAAILSVIVRVLYNGAPAVALWSRNNVDNWLKEADNVPVG